MNKNNLQCQQIIERAFETYVPSYREVLPQLNTKEEKRKYLLESIEVELNRFETFVREEISQKVQDLSLLYEGDPIDFIKWSNLLAKNYELRLTVEYSKALTDAFKDE